MGVALFQTGQKRQRRIKLLRDKSERERSVERFNTELRVR